MMHPLRYFITLTALVAASQLIGQTSPSQQVWVSTSKPDRLLVLQLDSESGTLSEKREIETSSTPGSFCFNQSGNRLYVSFKNPGSIAAYSVGKKSKPTLLGSSETGAYAGYLSAHSSGNYLFGSYYSTGEISVHRIQKKGAISIEPIQTLSTEANAHAAVSAPNGRFLFVPHTRPNKISQFRFDLVNGELSPNEPFHFIRNANTGPRHLWFHPRLSIAYGSDEQGSSISRYQFDPKDGTLSLLDTLPSIPGDFSGSNSTSDIEVHPSGKFVYIANRGHNSIAAFAIDEVDGALTFLERAQVDPVPRSFNITPDGEFIIVAGQQTNALKVFRVNEHGGLDLTQSLEIQGSPWWVVSRPRS